MPTNAPQLPTDQTVPKSNKKRLIILISILGILLITAATLLWQCCLKSDYNPLKIAQEKYQAATDSKPNSIPSPSPKPIKPIGTGTQEFGFNHGSKVTGPKLQKVVLDPIDPQPGESITITASLLKNTTLTKSDVIIETDNNTTIHELKTKDNLTYTAELKLKDTYDYNYYIKFNLESTDGNYDGGLRLRQL